MSHNPFAKFFNAIQFCFKQLFGNMTWQSPPWITYLRQQQLSWASCGWLILLLGVSTYGVYRYAHRAHPTLFTAQIIQPAITPVNKTLEPQPLIIDFGLLSEGSLTNQAVSPLKCVGKTVEQGIHLSPAMAGKWQWQTDSRLVFNPSQDWPAGQEYTLQFDKTFFADPKKMQSMHYTFVTQEFAGTIGQIKFYQDPLNPKVREVVATIHFNFPVDTESLDNHLSLVEQIADKSASQANHFKFTVTYDEHKRTAYLHSETIPLTNTARYIVLKLAPGIKSSSSSAVTHTATMDKAFIPDVSSYFKVSAVNASIVRNEKDVPEQVVTLETSLGATQVELAKSLHAYLLPQNYPASAIEAAKENYQWKNPGEVTAAILALAKPLRLVALPTDNEYATLHSYKIHANAPGYIYVQLEGGVKGFGDFTLNHDFATVVKVPEYPKEINFLHKGALLALSEEKILSVVVRGLPGVKFQIARVLPAEVNQLITQTRGDFNDPHFIHHHFNQDNISEIFSEVQTFDNGDAAQAQYSMLDLGKYLSATANAGGPQGLFLLHAQGWDPERKVSLEAKASRLILITDLGLVVKDNADGSHDVYVNSITKGQPVAKALIAVIGKNGLPILSQLTDDLGHVNFPSLKDYTDEKEATVYLAQQGSDVAFIPYRNFDRQLNFSRFNVGGVYNSDQDQQSLSAYIFSDRGIYRPGDTAHIAMIIKQIYAKDMPPGLPLEVTISDPRGATIQDKKFTLDAAGYSALDFAMQPTSMTGQYNVSLYIVKDNHPSNLLGSAHFKVAEFLPDTMRMTANLSTVNTMGWVSPTQLSASIGLWNLYGTPAAGRKISAKILLTPQAVKFTQFPDYTFIDPLLDPQKPPKVFADTLADTQTNEQGQAALDLHLDRFDKATYQLTFYAEGFAAEGGRSVTAQTSTLVSPLTVLVGYKAEGDLSYVKQGAVQDLHFITINPQVQPQSLEGLTLQLLSLHPVTTLVKNPDGTFQYQSLVQTTPLNRTQFAIDKSGTVYKLPTEQIGDYAVVILDRNNVELSRVKFSVVGASQQALPKNAELTIKLDKTEFMPDSDIEMQLTAPYTGSGLITIERDKVYAAQWFKADTTSSMQKIHIPKDFTGNGYVNVAFVRDWNSPEIFISPLSESVAPFIVNHANHNIHIDLQFSPRVRPGELVDIQYKSDKPGKIIVFAVDEGILQAGAYQTPDPLAFFFQKRALEVNTLQTLDQILPKFVQARELSAVGGDTGEMAALKTLNPFKRKTDLPVVYWSGIINTDTTDHHLQYQIPAYFNGTLRVMAVAVAADAVGAAEKSTEVRGDFVITPNLPTFASPGDEFEVTVNIANNVQGSGDNLPIDVSVSATPELAVVGNVKQTVQINEGKEKTARFIFKAQHQLGSGSISFAVAGANKKATLTEAISVRPDSAYQTHLDSGYSLQDEKILAVEQGLYPEYRQVTAALSPSPLILVSGLQRYLDNYPYGCTEQLVSKSVPLLALMNQPWFNPDKTVVMTKIQATIQQLAQRQMANGSFSYWPNLEMNNSNAFASVYALHFLTDARAAGFALPQELLRGGIDYLKELAAQDVNSLDEARIQAYAIYVLTRNEIVTTNYLTNLLVYLDKDPRHAWHDDIISAYLAATYQLMKSSAEAERLIGYYKPQSMADGEADFYNHSIADAQYLYLLAQHFQERLAMTKTSLVMPLVAALNSGEMNTLLSGFGSMALSAYAQANPISAVQDYHIVALDSDGKSISLGGDDSAYRQVSLDDKVKKVIFRGPSKVGYFYQLTQAGFSQHSALKSMHKGIEVAREYRDSQQNVVTSVSLGNELEVHVQIRALQDRYLTNVVIVDLLPGGFDVVRDSVKMDNVDYADIREDRVIFFASVGPEAKEIVYRIKATNVGKYGVAPVTASSMYDAGIVANGKSGTMEVTGEKV